MGVPTNSPSFLMFSIVGTAGSTRKRMFGSKNGRWWTASGWVPGPRTCTPWKVRRRIISRNVPAEEPLVEGGRKIAMDRVKKNQEDLMVTGKDEQKDKLSLEAEYENNKVKSKMNITGAGYLYQTLEEVAMQVDCLDRSMEDVIVAGRMEHKELLPARNLATSDKSQPIVDCYWAKDYNVSGTGITPDVGGQYQNLEQVGCMEDEIVARRMVQKELSTISDQSQSRENSYGAQYINVTGGGGDIAHVEVAGQPDDGLPQDIEDDGQQYQDHVAMNKDRDDGQHQVGGYGHEHDWRVGEVQEWDSQEARHHDEDEVNGAYQKAAIGDGYGTVFRKIARAKRKYSGTPDGRVQMRLSDLGFWG